MLLSRIARKAGIDRNPLRRRTDRVEAWLTVAVLSAALLFGPVVVWCAGAVAHDNEVTAAKQDRRQPRFKLDAVLQADAGGQLVLDDHTRLPAERVPAKWTAPDGTQRSGLVIPPSAEHAGAVVVIWTDAHGNLVGPPATHSPAALALTVGTVAAVGFATVVAVLLLVIRRRLDKLRLASWQVEWTQIEPRWSGRR
jgi:hypothetical protein